MNKTQLVEAVALKVGKKKDAEIAVSAVLEAISDALVQGEKVQIVGFGTFEVKERAAREGHNPATGAKITIPAAKHPVFSASKTLKESVNK